VGASDLHDTVGYSWPRQDLLPQREQRAHLDGGSVEVGVVHHPDEKRTGNAHAGLRAAVQVDPRSSR